MKRSFLMRSIVLAAIVFTVGHNHGWAFQSVPTQPSVSEAPTNSTLEQMRLNKRIQDAEAALDWLNQSRIKLDEAALRRRAAVARLDEIHISEESYAEIVPMLQSQRIQLMIDLAGLNARVEVEQERALKHQASAGTKASQKIVELFERKLALQRQFLETTKTHHEQGMQSSRELELAKQQVVEAEIELLESQRDAEVQRTQPVSYARLTDYLLQRAEKQARLETTEALLKGCTSARGDITSAGQFQQEYEYRLKLFKQYERRAEQFEDVLKLRDKQRAEDKQD